ncbi:hypothetical protein D3C78_1000830 [compost metagenome]
MKLVQSLQKGICLIIIDGKGSHNFFRVAIVISCNNSKSMGASLKSRGGSGYGSGRFVVIERNGTLIND